jgi:hypothetical protein
VPYQVDLRTDDIFVGFAVQTGLFRELERRGFDMRVAPSDDWLGRSHGAPRHAAHVLVVGGRQVGAPVGPGVEQLAHLEAASGADLLHMRRMDTELHDFLATPANLTARGRRLLRGSASDPDAQVLRRLLDSGRDSELANDERIAITHDLVLNDDHAFEHLLNADVEAHVLVDEYAFRVYLVPPA